MRLKTQLNSPYSEDSSEIDLYLGVFTVAYREAAMWSSLHEYGRDGDPCPDPDCDSEAEYLDDSPHELAEETLEKFETECKAFVVANWPILRLYDPDSTGHDFWLTRCGHGAGFWDGDYPEDDGEKLTEASKDAGERNLYVGDDGKVYQYVQMKRTRDMKTGIVINDEVTTKAFQEAIVFAIKVGKLSNFLAVLERLNRDADGRDYPRKTHLFKDFAPYSFTWTEFTWSDRDGEWQPGMHGGMIYHGKLLDGTQPETFSVTLEPEDGWSIHT